MNLKTCGITLILASLPFTALADDTRYYRGELLFESLSGSDCSSASKPGDRLEVELALRTTANSTEGYYYAGTAENDLQPGRFTGSSITALKVTYPYEPRTPPGEHRLSLTLDSNAPTGELREQILTKDEEGCNFQGRFFLKPAETDSAAAAFARLAKYYSEREGYRRGYDALLGYDIPEAIRQFEALVARQVTPPKASDDKLRSTLLKLSSAYFCAERFADGVKVLNQALGLPADQSQNKADIKKRIPFAVAFGAKYLAKQNKPEKAVALLKELTAAYPAITAIYPEVTEAVIEIKNTAPICGIVDEVYQTNKEDRHLRKAKRDCLAQNALQLVREDPDSVPQAVTFVEEAWRIFPEDINFVLSLCGIMTTVDPERALALLQANKGRITDEIGKDTLSDTFAVVYEGAAAFAARKHDYALAAAQMRKAIEYKPDNKLRVLKLTEYMQKEGKFPEAMNILRDLHKSCSKDGCREQVDKKIEQLEKLEALVKKVTNG